MSNLWYVYLGYHSRSRSLDSFAHFLSCRALQNSRSPSDALISKKDLTSDVLRKASDIVKSYHQRGPSNIPLFRSFQWLVFGCITNAVFATKSAFCRVFQAIHFFAICQNAWTILSFLKSNFNKEFFRESPRMETGFEKR